MTREGCSLPDAPWKANERKKCRDLGGVRTGPTGLDLPDCALAGGQPLPLIAPELKLYKTFKITEADFQQAVENAAKVQRMPVLVVKEHRRGGRDRVVMDYGDWLVLYRLAVGALDL